MFIAYGLRNGTERPISHFLPQLCVQAMADRDTIGGLLRVVSCCIGEELGLVGETLFCIFDTPDSDPLIAQVSYGYISCSFAIIVSQCGSKLTLPIFYLA